MLKAHSIQLSEVIYQAKGIVVLGRRIKSVIFTTDIAIIRNCNANAVLTVSPFPLQQVISEAIISASSIPIFVGVGGGMIKEMRSVSVAQYSEAHGVFGVVVNSLMSNNNIRLIHRMIDIPIISTVADGDDIQSRLDAGATILNAAAGKDTASVVAKSLRISRLFRLSQAEAERTNPFLPQSEQVQIQSPGLHHPVQRSLTR